MHVKWIENKSKTKTIMDDFDHATSVKLAIRSAKDNKNKENKKIFRATFHIGILVAEEINLNFSEKAHLFIDDQDPKKWLIKKTNTDKHSNKFVKLTGINLSQQSPYRKFCGSLSFSLYVDKNPWLNSEDWVFKTKKVDYEITPEGLVIFL